MTLQWQSMETAPRDGTPFVVKHVAYWDKKTADVEIVNWSEYSDGAGGWWLPDGAVIPYEDCRGWSPIPESED